MPVSPKKPAEPYTVVASETSLVSTENGFFNFKNAIAGKSPETQRKYTEWIRNFYREVVGVEMENYPQLLPIEPFLTNVTPAAVEAWLGKYASGGYSKSGLGQARASIVFMARMLVLAKQAPSSLWHDLKLVSLPDNAATGAYGESAGAHSGARWLSPDEVRFLMNSMKEQKNQTRATRDVALMWIMVTLGLRRDEAANLMWDSLNRRGGNWVLRIRGKRNKWRAVGVPQETIVAIQPWAEKVLAMEHDDEEGAPPRQGLPPGKLFRRVFHSGNISKDGITGNGIWKVITSAWEKTELPGDLAPHDLRRTAAAIALEAGANDREIQQMLGHSSIETTHRYLGPMRENTATYRIASMLSQEGDFWGS
jgi:integrase/recombinase XerC